MNDIRLNGVQRTDDVQLLYKGCEAFWRDTKYGVMARNYRYVKDLGALLRGARHDKEALMRWLLEVKRIEREPVNESALKNTVYHLAGYWKTKMTESERQALAGFISKNPHRALEELRQRLPDLGNPYLQTSVVWSSDKWVEALFRTRGRQMKLQVHTLEETQDEDGSLVSVKILDA